MIDFASKEEKIIHDQSEVIRKLLDENATLKEQLRQERVDHDRDIAFLKRVIIAALQETPSKRVTLFNDSPMDAEFSLESNLSNEMIVILKNIH